MVTHIPRKFNSSQTSLPLSPPLTSSSVSGPSSACHDNRQQATTHTKYSSRTLASRSDTSARSSSSQRQVNRRQRASGITDTTSSQKTPFGPDRPVSPPVSDVVCDRVAGVAGNRAFSVSSTPSVAGHGPPSAYRAPSSEHGKHRRPGSVSSIASTAAHHNSQSRPSSSRHVNHEQHRRPSSPATTSNVRQEVGGISNEFPYFGETGDVEIALRDRANRTEHVYLLHRLILVQGSKWWARELEKWRDEETSSSHNAQPRMTGECANARVTNDAQSSNRTRSRGSSVSFTDSQPAHSAMTLERKRWRYELDWSTIADDEEGIPLLKRVNMDSYRSAPTQELNDPPRPPPPKTRNKTKSSASGFFRNLASSFSSSHQHSRSQSFSSTATVFQQPWTQNNPYDTDILGAYHSLLLILYNFPPSLPIDSAAEAYVSCKHLLALSQNYGCLRIAGPRVDHHLLSFGSRLWKQVARYPSSYLKLAYLARSRQIFTEAIAHVVGQWPAASGQIERHKVDDRLVNLVEDKVDELEEMRLKIEAKLVRISLLAKASREGEDRERRRISPGPGSAWIDWLAVSIFRHWIIEHLTSSTTPNPTPTSSNRRATAYTFQLLERGGQAYLPYEELKHFLKYQPFDGSNRDALRRLERKIEELKDLARDTVQPLTDSTLELDVGQGTRGALPYFTCTRMEERDFAYIWEL